MNLALRELTKRNIKLYFKDKSTFLTSMISPMILLVLFVTFLGSVYKESFLSILPDGFNMDEGIVDYFTVSWLMSSIIGVSAVTVAFCANIIMPQDKLSGAVHDIMVAPIKKTTIAFSYLIGNFITTFIVCMIVAVIGFAYLGTIGWYLSVEQLLLIFSDIVITVLFGSSLASLVEHFLSTQGSISAVASLVSALYGFLCGAYMPISQFSAGIQDFISVLPGTYTMGLLRGHYMEGILEKAGETIPEKAIEMLKDGFDVNLYFNDNKVGTWQMYVVVVVAIAIFVGAYTIINKLQEKK